MIEVDTIDCPFWAFEKLVRAVLVAGRITLGNVDFWVDDEGAWADRLAYSIPTAEWVGVAEALTRALHEPLHAEHLAALLRSML